MKNHLSLRLTILLSLAMGAGCAPADDTVEDEPTPELAAAAETADVEDARAPAADEEALPRDEEGVELVAVSTGLRAAAKPFVGVPANYVYNPKLGSLHDYCTQSPDEFPAPGAKNANFRGPCARHDLCYGGTTAKATCDSRLRTDMRTNCAYQYSAFNPLRSACYKTAEVYWTAVTAFGDG
jgi:Prokaryotic phospholipase A2